MQAAALFAAHCASAKSPIVRQKMEMYFGKLECVCKRVAGVRAQGAGVILNVGRVPQRQTFGMRAALFCVKETQCCTGAHFSKLRGALVARHLKKKKALLKYHFSASAHVSVSKESFCVHCAEVPLVF